MSFGDEPPQDVASRLGISRAAAELFHDAEVIDLHLDSYIWSRVFRYDLQRRHGPGPFGGRFLSQVDVPRLIQVGVDAATWVVTTNPFRSEAGRTRALRVNLDRLVQELELSPRVRLVRDVSTYRAARASGCHAAFVGLQGGNALGISEEHDAALASGLILRVTLLHLTRSHLGSPSTCSTTRGAGLSAAGCQLIERLNAHRVFVDLAHISRDGFFRALDVHSRAIPPIVTHTGLSGVTPSWRNLDDAQLRAIADRGGLVGVLFHSPYLGDGTIAGHFRSSYERIVDHIDHVVRSVGDEHVSLGSDFDGFISPPRDLRTCLELPRLVEGMLQRGYGETRIRRILGGNFLRVLAELRG